MSIVSSTVTQDDYTQPDGSRYTYEVHTDSTGRLIKVSYRAAAGFDINARLALRAVEIAERLAETEATQVLG